VLKNTPREIAIGAGAITYQGKRCPVCQSAERFTNCGKCIPCHRVRRKRYAEAHKERLKAVSAEWRRKHPERAKELYRARAARIKANRKRARTEPARNSTGRLSP
jgi:hypothetical protein